MAELKEPFAEQLDEACRVVPAFLLALYVRVPLFLRQFRFGI
jgi:hypothetical protein